MNIGLYTLTSLLHDASALDAASSQFVARIEGLLAECPAADGRPCGWIYRGPDFSDYGTHDLDVIYVRTGGTEGLFEALFEQVTRTPEGRLRPVRLLTSGRSNSLAASMEILSYLRLRGCPGEIIHGSDDYIARRLALLARVEAARCRLDGMRLGIVGKPSDWLIASAADPARVRDRLGIELTEVPMEELLAEIARREYPRTEALKAVEEHVAALPERVKPYWTGALEIYGGLKRIVERYRLDGLTIRCFDLLERMDNTGCLALALLNAEGIPSGCEGDVPALLSMAVAHALTGVSGFQANPSRIDPETGEMVLAHCTVPLDMVRRFVYDTHFESGRGVAIRGELPEGAATVFKLAGDLSRSCVFEAELKENLCHSDLCRTQIVLRAPGMADYFLRRPIGNHHIVLPGRHKEAIEALLQSLE